MPNNNSGAKNTTVKKPVRKRVKYFKITINLKFEPQFGSVDDLEKEEGGWRDESNKEFCARLADWENTEHTLGTEKSIIEHIKKNDPMDMVENLCLMCEEVISAKWLDGFAISYVVKCTDKDVLKASKEEGEKMIEEDLRMTSLEDGEYESSGDNGWTVKTIKETMEYGLTDYRQNPIMVEEIKAVRKVGVKKTNGKTRRRR